MYFNCTRQSSVFVTWGDLYISYAYDKRISLDHHKFCWPGRNGKLIFSRRGMGASISVEWIQKIEYFFILQEFKNDLVNVSKFSESKRFSNLFQKKISNEPAYGMSPTCIPHPSNHPSNLENQMGYFFHLWNEMKVLEQKSKCPDSPFLIYYGKPIWSLQI